MTRIALACTACQVQLSGGTDTFGDVGMPFCWECYGELNGTGGIGEEGRGGYYGLAPHHHDLSITGSIVGSTVFDPLPEPNANGEYVLGNMIYTPGPDPYMGFWDYRPLPGWR